MRALLGRLTIISGLAFCALGCRTIATERYHGFAELTNGIFANAQETDDRVHLIHVRFRVVTASDDPLTPSSFQVISGATDAELAEALEIRTAAVGVLLHYSHLVDVIASGESPGQIAKVARQLEPSVQEFQDVAGLHEAGPVPEVTAAADEARRLKAIASRSTLAHSAMASLKFISKRSVSFALGPAGTRLLAAAIGTTASYGMSRRRQRELLDIMQHTQPDLETLSSIVARSNDAIRTATDLMVAEIVSRANAVRPPRDDPHRIAFDADIAALLENKDTIMENLDSLAITMTHFPSAHAELIALLEGKPTNRQSLRALSREAQRIEQDFQSLK